MTWFWMNIPLGVVFVAAWSGIPLWLVLRHPPMTENSPASQLTPTSGATAATLSREEQRPC
jgi:hypothetical protein